MTLRGVLLCDGPSDMALAAVVEKLCFELGEPVVVTAIDPLVIQGRSVADRFAWLDHNESHFDLAFVHRDAEGSAPTLRRDEIVSVKPISTQVVPVVPVRMTEAWLILDEGTIRQVAGRPNGQKPLGLPKATRAESVADPKSLLRHALESAAEPNGRRKAARLRRDFGLHRKILLERLEPSGPVSQLESFQQLRADLAAVLGTAPSHG